MYLLNHYWVDIIFLENKLKENMFKNEKGTPTKNISNRHFLNKKRNSINLGYDI